MNLKGSNILVTGGAGYIGTHVLLELLEVGSNPIVIDNLSNGIKELVPEEIPLVIADIKDTETIEKTITNFKIDTVIHLAGSIVVPESLKNPSYYYENNVSKSLNLLQVCIKKNIDNFVFASTAAVYAPTTKHKITEDSLVAPTNPYGRSKMMVELMLKDIEAISNLNYVNLRFFNVAGADKQLRTGHAGSNNTHLIKVACEVAHGLRDHVEIFGTDYSTPDRTCVRDYIHVSDLASALVASVEYLRSNNKSLTLNCGYSIGTSVREVINAINAVLGRTIKTTEGLRRAGDSESIISDANSIKEVLDWHPSYTSIDSIVRTALDWEETLLNRSLTKFIR
jgi:UDP-glucose 4-epimerase